MSKKKEHPAPPVEPVHLKKTWNLEPPVYLTIIWAGIIIVAFYGIAILPGQIKSGRYYTISSPVQGSAVYLDGEYLGSGTITEFIPSGSYTLRFDFRDIASHEMVLEVNSSVLFTHLFPKKHPITSPYYLDSHQLKEYLDQLFHDVIIHSSILSYDDVYHYPPLFTYAARTAIKGDMGSLALYFLRDSALFVTSTEMRSDYLEAIDMLTDHGVTTDGELEVIRDKLIALSYEDYQRPSSPPEYVSQPGSVDTLAFSDIEIRGYRYEGGVVQLGRKLSRETYPGVQEGLVEAVVDPFTMGESEISEYLWARFLEECPSWSKENKEELIDQKLVDESYLDGIYPSTAFESMTPIRNISYHAAQAFTEWLSEKTGRDVSLPSSAQWEYAGATMSTYSKTLSSYRTGSAPAGLLGGVWEMTGDSYVPLSRYLSYTIDTDHAEAMIMLKGGSYLNDSQSIDTARIGLIAKDECSDTAGFRIVWN
ncbi:MAG: SUMF1/EgtB/PvdO family nonheme iron enzyme [Sphaerochaetaceae bacterium]|nr:SUMF1/EgtB/PvdO family nonheme iron enzyme [Sphaerochaetaceae bacterium]